MVGMRRILSGLVLLILLASCEKDRAARKTKPDYRASLSVIKTKLSGEENILNTIDYNDNGTVKTRISYKDYTSGLVSSKAEYIYKDNRLVYIEEETNYGSAFSSDAPLHNRSVLEYDAEGKVIQKNYFQYNGTQLELKSFTTFTYNIQGLPVMENRYTADGALTGYSIYEYDKDGNVKSASIYSINELNPTPVLASKVTYTYDSGLNPYRKIYTTVENIPFSVNRNNVVQTKVTDYSKLAVNLQPAETMVEYIYNKNGLPSVMEENGNRFFLEYH